MVSPGGFFLSLATEPGLTALLDSPAGKVADLPIGEALLSPGLGGGGDFPGLLFSLVGEVRDGMGLAPSTFGEQSMDSSNGLTGLGRGFLSDCLYASNAAPTSSSSSSLSSPNGFLDTFTPSSSPAEDK